MNFTQKIIIIYIIYIVIILKNHIRTVSSSTRFRNGVIFGFSVALFQFFSLNISIAPKRLKIVIRDTFNSTS